MFENIMCLSICGWIKTVWLTECNCNLVELDTYTNSKPDRPLLPCILFSEYILMYTYTGVILLYNL